MKEFSLVCFDLDGTLADTSEGIYVSYYYTCKQFGFTIDDVTSKLSGVIGSRPIDVFTERMGLAQDRAEAAVRIYRDYYERNGLYRSYLYPGIEELLDMLHDQGYHLAVTTLKYEPFAKELLMHLGIAKYFDAIFGCGADNKDTKVTLLHKAMAQFQTTGTRTLLIGDSEVDALGAEAAGIAFAGVTYGLGFCSEEEISVFHPQLLVKNVSELLSFF